MKTAAVDTAGGVWTGELTPEHDDMKQINDGTVARLADGDVVTVIQPDFWSTMTPCRGPRVRVLIARLITSGLSAVNVCGQPRLLTLGQADLRQAVSTSQ